MIFKAIAQYFQSDKTTQTKNISKNNGLTEDENIILFNSIDFYEIIALIIKGLGIILGKKR